VRRLPLLVGLCALLLGAQCFRSPAEVPPWDTPVRVVVRNGYAATVEVYVTGSGINQRLGTVHPGMEGRFEVPHTMVGRGVELLARAASQDDVRSGRLNIQPGHTVLFEITAQLYNSTATIQP
jgi:hypothetical protein